MVFLLCQPVSHSQLSMQATLLLLESVCCNEDNDQHRSTFIERGGISVLVKLLGSTNDRELLAQVVRMLTSLANLDVRTKQEVINNGSCLQFLQELLIANNGVRPHMSLNAAKIAEAEHSKLFPLSNHLVADIRLLFQVHISHKFKPRNSPVAVSVTRICS